MATQECSVCCEPYNKSTHLKIACEHSGACEFEACKTCVRKYILGTTADPNCMHCNKAWSDKFLTKNLNATFMRNDYKAHRKELLVQQQISRLPETMAAAERQKQEDTLRSIIKELDSQKFTAQQHLRRIRHSLHSSNKTDIIIYHKKIEEALETVSLIQVNIDQARYNLNIHRLGGNVSGEEKKEARKFIMPCGNSDCRGYLTKQYKCELCEHHTCAKCFENIGLIKEEGAHECKPENIESAEFIKKQSKPCPCCGTRISKIDGCDQMWCTQCHKAFSWNTGKLVSGTIHNPHFYQYQRENGGLARNPGDVVCGGLPTYYDLNNKVNLAGIPRSYQNFFYNTLMYIHRLQNHFTFELVNGLRLTLPNEQDYEDERIRYILKKTTREGLANNILAKDSKRKQNTAILHVFELFTTVGADMFHRIIASEKKGEEFATELTQQVEEYDTLRKYVNDQLKDISMTYGICVQQIKPDWTTDSVKFNTKGSSEQFIIQREKQRQAAKVKAAEVERAERERREAELQAREEKRQAAAKA